MTMTMQPNIGLGGLALQHQHVTHTPSRSAGSIASALVKARKAVTGIVLKEGRASMGGAGNYSYVGHEDVIRYGRNALLDNGLALIETGSSFVRNETYESRKGNAVVSVWRGAFVLLHDSGEQLALSYDCMTQVSDKGGFVASTALDRTAILRVLHLAGSDYVDVPESEDPEHNSNNQPAATVAPQQKAAQAQDTAKQKAKQTADHISELEEKTGFLAPMEKPEELISWGVALHLHAAAPALKSKAWTAFGARAAAVGLDPSDLKAAILSKAKAG